MRETPSFVPEDEADADYWKTKSENDKKAYKERLKQDREKLEKSEQDKKDSGFEKWEKESGPNFLKSKKAAEELEKLKRKLFPPDKDKVA